MYGSSEDFQNSSGTSAPGSPAYGLDYKAAMRDSILPLLFCSLLILDMLISPSVPLFTHLLDRTNWSTNLRSCSRWKQWTENSQWAITFGDYVNGFFFSLRKANNIWSQWWIFLKFELLLCLKNLFLHEHPCQIIM